MNNVVNLERKNAEFLIELYKNVQMGKYALVVLLPRCKDQNLKRELLSQYHDFEKLSNAICGGVIDLGFIPKGSTCMQNLMLKMAIKTSTFFNNSPKKLADMVIQGDNKGIIDINRLINQSTFATDTSHALARLVLETEQKHIDELKKYLWYVR